VDGFAFANVAISRKPINNIERNAMSFALFSNSSNLLIKLQITSPKSHVDYEIALERKAKDSI
jgi:hypothetical protein